MSDKIKFWKKIGDTYRSGQRLTVKRFLEGINYDGSLVYSTRKTNDIESFFGVEI